jgi:chromosome segregation ATPase
MGKDSKKKLEARLTEADAGIRDLESTRAALTEELRAARERHTEVMSTLRRKHDQLVDEIKRSTQDELTRVGDELAEARAALEKATEENSRLAADLRDRDEHSRTLLQDLDDVVEAALGQLSGALMRIRDAAPAAASDSTPEDESTPEAALIATHAEARASESDDATAVAEEVPEPDAPIEVAEPADPAGDDEEMASYEDDWYRFLKHTQARDDEDASPPA